MQSIIPQPVTVLCADIPLKTQESHTNIVQLLSVAAHQASDSDIYFQCCYDNQILSLQITRYYHCIYLQNTLVCFKC